jgi:hypothetical protein
VHSVRPARRATEDGEPRTDIVALITQRRQAPIDPANPAAGNFTFRGGCTLLLDREYDAQPIRYAIARPIWNTNREERVRRHLQGRIGYAAVYGGDDPNAGKGNCSPPP